MTDLTTMHLKCLLERSEPGPWEERKSYRDGGHRVDDSRQIISAAGEYMGIMYETDVSLAVLAPQLAEEVIRLRGEIKGLITAMEIKAASGGSQSPAAIVSYLKEAVLGEHDE